MIVFHFALFQIIFGGSQAVSSSPCNEEGNEEQDQGNQADQAAQKTERTDKSGKDSQVDSPPTSTTATRRAIEDSTQPTSDEANHTSEVAGRPVHNENQVSQINGIGSEGGSRVATSRNAGNQETGQASGGELRQRQEVTMRTHDRQRRQARSGKT